MKKLLISLLFLALATLIACDLNGDEQVVPEYANLQATPYYHKKSFRLNPNHDLSWGGGLFLHNQQLHLYVLDRDDVTGNTYLALITMDADGANEEELFKELLDDTVDFFTILGFEKHYNDYISLITRDSIILPPYTREDAMQGVWSFETSTTYTYRHISPEGTIVSESGIDFFNEDPRQITLYATMFDLEGNIIAAGVWSDLVLEDMFTRSLFFLNRGLTGELHEAENEAFAFGFRRMRCGKIISPTNISPFGAEFILFYEIDFENAYITDGPKIEAGNHFNSAPGVFPAPATSLFDFYIVSWTQMFGYNESDGLFTPLVDFNEFGILPSYYTSSTGDDILFWDDGRITLLEWKWSASLNRFEVTVSLLTPSDEPWHAERQTLTLGGIDINLSPLIEQVAEFNRTSPTHIIELVAYALDDMERLRAELVTGRGPDVFMLSWWGADLVATLAEGHFILDLYQMIDADPVLSREDFFPSILSTWENSRGELAQIAPDFSIQTIMGLSSEFPNAPDSWNYADFISFYQEARAEGHPYPFGQTLDRFLILEKLLFTDDTFFSERNGIANFESQAFIDVLNFAMTIPDDQGWENVAHLAQTGQWDPISNLVNGEQLLLPFANINHLMHFRTLQARLGGITAFGFPSNDAPTHAVQVSSGTAMGIRANSPHVDAAWEFVRLSLLPDTSHDDNTFPMRIDLFEQLIYDELSRAEPTTVFGGGNEHELPPMTEADVNLLRELIANIGHKPVNDHPVQNIVNEDVIQFFAGTRNAEDTARIIQSRVGIVLAERMR